ncbi:Endonuclease/exonuclease/phosphatase [Gorgonomyces haynaldii]|nr:Endonuclease/exonuclease/phosphatase [Gorgonomyces haynaldii]
MLELGFEISQDNVDRIENQPYSEAMFLYTPMFAERKEQVYYRFDNTCMNRGLIVTKAVFGQQQRQIVFATSHLESEKQFSKERMQQLRWSFDKLHEHAGDCGWIFGGDMNLRTDDDVGELPEGVVDCWEAVGSPKEHEITWDTIQNTNLRAPYKLRMRLDRLYAYKATPLSFKTVGKEQISHGEGAEFMSDHWGLLSEFQV